MQASIISTQYMADYCIKLNMFIILYLSVWISPLTLTISFEQQ